MLNEGKHALMSYANRQRRSRWACTFIQSALDSLCSSSYTTGSIDSVSGQRKGPFSCAAHHMMIMSRAKGRSNFASVHTDKAFRCPLTNKLDTREYINAVSPQTFGVSRAYMIRLWSLVCIDIFPWNISFFSLKHSLVSPLSFITAFCFGSICSLWCFTDEVEDTYADQTYVCNLKQH